MKLGHGGTLDPLATGVLIVGVGSGTKSLNQFLACTKTYETVVLFGAATDSYDAVGKIVAKAPTKQITQNKVEEALARFRGKIMQKPPIFSALKVKGKPMYEYARNGEEIPIEIEDRPVEVHQLELLEWLDGGSHKYRYPTEEAESGVKAVAQKVIHVEDTGGADVSGEKPPSSIDSSPNRKRKREESIDDLVTGSSPSTKMTKPSPERTMSGALPLASVNDNDNEGEDSSAVLSASGASAISETIEDSPPPVSPNLCPAPAVRLRMTTSGGFYVRSLAHDLGAAVGSLGLMAELKRSRQAAFELGKNVFELDEIGKGEDVWGPQLEGMLESWRKAHTDANSESP